MIPIFNNNMFIRLYSLYRKLSELGIYRSIFSLFLILSIICSSVTLIYFIVSPQTGEKFTEFYILDQNGIASDYPSDLTLGEEGKIIIGIVNHEYENITYRLEVNFNGSQIYEEYVFLIENEKWEIPFIFKAIEKGENQKLDFLLYKLQQIEAYRILHLWVNIT